MGNNTFADTLMESQGKLPPRVHYGNGMVGKAANWFTEEVGW